MMTSKTPGLTSLWTNYALHGHLESTTPMLEDISNQNLILQQSLFTIWTIGFVIHLVQVYYNLDYWTHHSFGSELFQPGQPFCITSSCFWSFAKIFTIWTIGFIIHLALDYTNFYQTTILLRILHYPTSEPKFLSTLWQKSDQYSYHGNL